MAQAIMCVQNTNNAITKFAVEIAGVIPFV